MIADEVNVKEVDWKDSGKKQIKLDTSLPHELKLEGLAREVIRRVQDYRKELGLSVADRIHLSLEADSGELKEAIEAFSDLINDETLSAKLDYKTNQKQPKSADIEGAKLKIGISKASK